MIKNKTSLKTVRLSPEEALKIDHYIKKNPIFNGFSALARTAVLAFIESESLAIGPSPKSAGDIPERRPYFLADQNMSEGQIRHILKNGSEIEQISIASRLISEAQWNDIWNYTTPEDLIRLFPKLWFWPDSRRIVWQRILEEWKETGELICPKELQNEIKSEV